MTTVCEIALESVLSWLNEWRSHSKRPLVVGVSGPQGSGKSTLVANLATALAERAGVRSCVLSVDDGYLTFDEQQKLAAEHPENSLLQYRGLPGTHSIQLIRETIERLTSNRLPVKIPSYDKALRGGRGDRLAESQWTTINEPVDVVLFEGWFLGFRSYPNEQLGDAIANATEARQQRELQPDATKYPVMDYSLDNMAQVMRHLAEYERLWYPLLDAFVQIVPEHVEHVFEWRWEQEETMRRRLGDQHAGLSRARVEDFVARFMPLYELCLPRLTNNGFFGGDPSRMSLQVCIDRMRRPINQ